MKLKLQDGTVGDRIILALIGALAGLAVWVLVEVLPEQVANKRLLLFVTTATGGFFVAFLAAIGPLSLLRAAWAAAVAAMPAAGLLTWASTRFDAVDGSLETLHPLVAYAVILLVSMPFLIAGQRAGDGWRDYPALFRESWNIVVRYAAALLFVGVFWALVLVSDALFSLVGLTIIEDLIETEPVPYLLSGAVLGLALAVVVELSDYLSPFLVLRLLRLLVPVVVVVIAVFLAALPLRGLSDLFGGLSAAAILLAMAGGVATLITSALDRDDDEAAQGAVTRMAVQLLALSLPVLAGLAMFSVWLRVKDYGWTPDRLAAMTAAGIVTSYGLLYAVSVLARGDWPGRIRKANILMALVTVAVAVLWLTPVLNPQRISASNQIARFVSGKTDIEQLDLWFLGRELGRAGENAVAELAALDPASEALNKALARLATAQSRYDFEQRWLAGDPPDLIAAITADIAVLPAGAVLPADALEAAFVGDQSAWASGCARRTPLGRPGCAVLMADFLEKRPGDEALMFWMTGPASAAVQIMQSATATEHSDGGLVFLSGNQFTDITPATLDALRDGSFSLAPAAVLSLGVNGVRIILQP